MKRFTLVLEGAAGSPPNRTASVKVEIERSEKDGITTAEMESFANSARNALDAALARGLRS